MSHERDVKLAAIQRRLSETGFPNHMASVKFSQQDLEICCEMMESDHYRHLMLPPEHSPVRSAPEAPTVGQQHTIEDFAATLPRPEKVEVPWWCRPLCNNRDLFEDVALGVGCAHSDVVYLLLFAKQSPFSATFLQLTRVPLRPVSEAGDLDEGELDQPPGDRAEFAFLPMVVLNESDLLIGEDEDLFVYPCVRFEGDRAATNKAAILFEVFVLHHPRSAPVRARLAAPRRRALGADDRAKLLAENPWLDVDDLPGMQRPRGSHGPVAGRKRPGARDRDEDIDVGSGEDLGPDLVADPDEIPFDESEEDMVAEVDDPVDEKSDFDEADLAGIRDELAWDEAEDAHFYLHILGGKWTKDNKGVAADAAGGYARKGSPTDWCKLFNWPRSASFMFNKYGRDGATELAKEYCRRSHFFGPAVHEQLG